MGEEGGRATISTFWLKAESAGKEITWCTDAVLVTLQSSGEGHPSEIRQKQKGICDVIPLSPLGNYLYTLVMCLRLLPHISCSLLFQYSPIEFFVG